MTIDLPKVREYLRRMPHRYLFAMLDEAVELLPKARLEQLVRRYIPQDDVAKAAHEPKPWPTLLAEVNDFAGCSRRGDYFESFHVNSRNCTEQSNGTTAWIADCNRLLDRCVARAKGKRGRAEALAAFEVLFDLIEVAASSELDIVFFADEGGLWSFGIEWQTVFEAWVCCAAEIEVDDDTFAARVANVMERFGRGEPGMTMAAAHRARQATRRARPAGRPPRKP